MQLLQRRSRGPGVGLGPGADCQRRLPARADHHGKTIPGFRKAKFQFPGFDGDCFKFLFGIFHAASIDAVSAGDKLWEGNDFLQ